MEKSERERLRELARKATPGPWRVQTHHDQPGWKSRLGVPVVRAPWPELPHGTITVARCGNGNSGSERHSHIREREEGNAAFIAAFDPDAALDLLDDLAKAEELIRSIAFDPHCAYPDPLGPALHPEQAQYAIGVADGHRCAAAKARAFLTPPEPPA